MKGGKTMNKISEVFCYYTGGGIYVYSAKYGNAYLYGTLDEYISCYRVRGEILYQDSDICEFYGWTDEMNSFRMEGTEDDYFISPDEIEYPAWNDILESLNRADCLGSGVSDMEKTLRYWNPDLTKHTNED